MSQPDKPTLLIEIDRDIPMPTSFHVTIRLQLPDAPADRKLAEFDIAHSKESVLNYGRSNQGFHFDRLEIVSGQVHDQLMRSVDDDFILDFRGYVVLALSALLSARLPSPTPLTIQAFSGLRDDADLLSWIRTLSSIEIQKKHEQTIRRFFHLQLIGVQHESPILMIP